MPEIPSAAVVPGGVGTSYDILPIFFCEKRPAPEASPLVAFAGTGFRLSRDVLITCWHCVARDEDGHGYAVALKRDEGYRMHPLFDVAKDVNGTDLATAKIFEIDSDPLLGLTLAATPRPGGTDVWTWGYPLTEMILGADGEPVVRLNGRYLEGYVTRSFWYEHEGHGRIEAYECDMPAPRGLSGAPLVIRPGTEVIGVIHGVHDVGLMEELASVDPETGERIPELQRIVSFALAHYTTTLRDLAGPATDGQPLSSYLGV